jgi:hypothetical protein
MNSSCSSRDTWPECCFEEDENMVPKRADDWSSSTSHDVP